MFWLILIMPLSMSGLNCAISLGREGPGNCFTISGLLSVKLSYQFGKRRAGELFYNNRPPECLVVPSVWKEKGRGVVLHQPVCSGLNCAISLCKEGLGCRFTPTGLLRVITQYILMNRNDLGKH